MTNDGHLELEQVAEELEQFRINLGPVGAGRLDRLVDGLDVDLADFPLLGPDVGPIDGEAGDDLADHRREFATGVVAITLLVLADLGELRDEAVDVAPE
jgi:hypothetical protein